MPAYNYWKKALGDTELSKQLYRLVLRAYSAKGRHYHTIRHIEDILAKLEKLKALKPSTIIAAFYHDYIYSSISNRNERDSANICLIHLNSLGIEQYIINESIELILCTENHESINNSSLLFLDIDMSIMGSAYDDYVDYTSKVRKEYSIIPNFLYKKGRRKFLTGLLNKEHVFITSEARILWEEQAKINITSELATLL